VERKEAQSKWMYNNFETLFRKSVKNHDEVLVA